MSIEFKLPPVGENIDKADIGNILVKEGDTLTAGQVVMEIETDKAVFELPCPHAGKVGKLNVKQGQSVKIGELLLTIEGAEAGASDSKKAPANQEAEKPAAKGEAETAPAKPEPAKKATAASTSQPSDMPVRTVAPPAATAAGTNSAAKVAQNGDDRPPAPAGPATRRLARELGVDLYRVKATGPNGRITPEDVQAFVRQFTSGSQATPAGAAAGALVIPPLPDFTQFGEVERVPMNKVGKMSAANLSLSWQVVPHVTQHEMVDITDLETGRKRFVQRNESAPKVTMTVLAMKAVVSALKAFPNFNSSYDPHSGEILLKKYYNIGVAVDTENGLLVPVIRDVDRKSVADLAGELTDLSVRARARKLQVSEMTGGTFTITNLGGIGGSFFTPIVNYPEVAILGMSRSVQQYVIIDGKPEIRLMLPVSLSYDHRVVNGADAARFVVKLAGMLADPFKLLSEV